MAGMEETTMILKDIKEYTKLRKAELKEQVSAMAAAPRLAIIQVGTVEASTRYVRNKIKDCEEVGIEVELTTEFKKEYTNPTICQLPYDGLTDKEAIEKANIPAELDVDGFNTLSDYKPCTPMGVINYLKHLDKLHTDTAVVIIGRGELVGKPLVDILMNDKSLCGAVNVITSKTPKYITKSLIPYADVVITATGHSLDGNLLQMILPITTVVDCGIQIIDGKLSGDIPKQYYPYLDNVADYTPVPNGVGLLTRLTLLQHVWDYYKK
jgi:methylenetetrahydrofolate dehydrogenase (NADP+)/methenyltetrahydrofolate cyclohydrolase